MKFKVIIAGGRDFNDYLMMEAALDYALSKKIKDGYDIEIVSGDARGADSLGVQYANKRGFAVKHFPAEWDKFGKSAGYKRNAQMADYADALYAFWDGQSKGTAHMIVLARQKRLQVHVKYYSTSGGETL